MRATTVFAVAAALLLTGCATVDKSHVGLSEQLEKGIAHQELKYMRLLDRFEKDSRAWVDERMLKIDGPGIMKKAVKKANFDKKIGRNRCALEQAHDLLEFTLDASANFEKRKAKEMAQLDDFFFKLRSAAREDFGLLRQASSTLSTGLRAYVKEKEWRKDLLRSWDVPVDEIGGINRAGLGVRRKMEAAD